jgi:hypothetical protein
LWSEKSNQIYLALEAKSGCYPAPLRKICKDETQNSQFYPVHKMLY